MKTTNNFLKSIAIVVMILGSNYLIAQTNTSQLQTVCVGSLAEPYLINPPTPGSTYQWTLFSGGTIASGQGTSSITVDWGMTPGGPHTLEVVETDASNCVGMPITVDVTLILSAVASAGSPDNVCAGSTYTLGGTSASNYSAISWTTSGTGSFNPTNTLTPTYTPSAADIAAGNVILTLTATGNSPCGDATSTMVLTIIPAATADAGADDNICEGSTYTLGGTSASNYSAISWTTSGTGSFNPTNTLTPTYTPSAADIAAGNVILTLTATGNSPCGDATSTMVLTIIPAATADAGADDNICEGSTYTLGGTSASNYSAISWTTSGTGSFNPTNTLTPTYTPSAADIAAGNVILTLTATGNSPCGDATSTMVLTIIPAATADAGADDNICEGSTYTLGGTSASNYSAISWTTSGTGSFNPTNTLTPTYTPSAADIAAGNVILTLTATGNSPCGDATSTMVLTIIPAATADAGADDNVCEGSTYTLGGTSASNYSAISWTTSGTGSFNPTNTLTPTYTPSAADIAAGNVILTLTATGNSPCGDATSTMVLTIIPAATADAGADDNICEGSTYTLGGTSASNYSAISWTTSGTGSFNPTNTLTPTYTPSAADIAAGNVILTLTATGNSPCGDATSTMVLTIDPIPTTGPINHW